jgi:hypothetical protein
MKKFFPIIAPKNTQKDLSKRSWPNLSPPDRFAFIDLTTLFTFSNRTHDS